MNVTPKKLLLLDGFGALLSAFLLGVVLVKLEHLVGMPRNVLYFLAFLPCLFALYDFVCYFQNTKNSRTYLKGTAIANLLYCCISLACVLFFWQELTILGHLYFWLELIIVAVLAVFELKVASSDL